MYHISNDKRSIESSTWICQALHRLVEQIPFDKIKITDLCKEAKVGRVTFYRHFDTIEDILRKEIDDQLYELIEYIKEYRQTEENKKNFIVPFLRYWYVNPSVLRLLFEAEKDFILSESIERVLVQNHLNLFSFSPDKEDEYFNRLRFSIYTSILKQWFKNDMDILPEKLAEYLVRKMKKMLEQNTFL